MRYEKIMVAILVFTPAPALAWTDRSEDGHCGFAQTFEGEGETTFMVSQSKELFTQDAVLVAIYNDKWSIKEGDDLKGTIKIESDDGSFFSNTAIAMDQGLLLPTPNNDFHIFTDSNPTMVLLYRNNKVIDRLNFDEFGAALLKFEVCRADWVKAKAEQDHLDALKRTIPVDPFATPVGPAKPILRRKKAKLH